MVIHVGAVKVLFTNSVVYRYVVTIQRVKIFKHLNMVAYKPLVVG